ncbi:DNA topoisomerase III [Longicatena caecimuris]|uniref:DNA topoisomerase III n=2 Tax=Longicatena caecimuris TaxID=1796635 RepID=UPI0018AA4EB5|nr:DNA topoisomerase III [Longicatena caecimuris]
MKTLVLAEKPSVGKELGRVLGCTMAKDGYMENKQYVVTWAFGHLVELADPSEYDKRYETWDMQDLPMLPEKMKLKVISQTARQYRLVKTLLQRKDVTQIIIATDAGREGELVARWILDKANCHKPMQRLWISSQTDKAIKEGFAHLRPAKEFEPLYKSAVCRAEADWLVGLNVTRALTCKYNAQLSAGRVQTPILAMIVAREEEIRHFQPKEFATIKVELDGFVMEYRKQGQAALFDLALAEQLQHSLAHGNITIDKVECSSKKELSPQLYDLTELQRDANKRFGFSAKYTLNLMQSLYETHKVLTYPRSDSRYLSADIVPTLKERLQAIAIDAYEPFAHTILKKGIKVNKRIVDDSKVSDHHAIIPTEEYVELQRLSHDERCIYDLVIRRFLAVLSDVCLYEKTRIEGSCNKHHFFASGKIMKQAGWRSLYQRNDVFDEEEEEEIQSLPIVKQGQNYAIRQVIKQKSFTKPPLRYTEASLLSAMEHPAKFIHNAKWKQVLEDANGIGTVATRADIIEKLFHVNYIEKRGNTIYPLSKGIQLINLVPEQLRSPLLTAQWEDKLTKISQQQLKPQQFMKEMRSYASSLVEAVKQSEASYRHDNMTQKKCPECGNYLLEVNGKRGKRLVCSNPACKYKQNLTLNSNARCPNCHKKLTVVGEKEKRLYTCTCGFREKFDRFNEQLKQKNNKAGKQELKAYMRKQEQAVKQEKSAFQLAWEAALKK